MEQRPGRDLRTGTITALISSGDITERLRDAAPQLAVIAAATGLRALLGIAVVWLTGRLRPVLGRAAELTMVEAALGAELAANNKFGYNDAYDIADRGAQVTPDLVEEAQDVIAATATLAAGAAVLTVLDPVLLPLLFLACLPQAAAYVRSARVIYLAGLETSGRRRMLGKLRWHMAYMESSEEMRACLAGPFLTSRYRKLAASVNTAERKAANTGAWMGLAGALAGGIASIAVWAALLWLLASGRMSLAAGGGAVFALQTATGFRTRHHQRRSPPGAHRLVRPGLAELPRQRPRPGHDRLPRHRRPPCCSGALRGPRRHLPLRRSPEGQPERRLPPRAARRDRGAGRGERLRQVAPSPACCADCSYPPKAKWPGTTPPRPTWTRGGRGSTSLWSRRSSPTCH